MRKKLAWLLAVIMLINVWTPISVSGAPVQQIRRVEFTEFNLRELGIKFDGSGSTLPTEGDKLKAEEAAVEWLVTSTGVDNPRDYIPGVYRLEYAVNTLAGPKKVRADFYIGRAQKNATDTLPTTFANNPEAAVVQVSIFNSDGILQNAEYDDLRANETVSSKPNFTKTLDLASTPVNKEIDLKVSMGGAPLNIKMQLKGGGKGGQVQLMTNGIQAGYVTPFELYYGAYDTSKPESDPSHYPADSSYELCNTKLNYLRKLEQFRVLPQHIYADPTMSSGINSKALIYSNDVVAPGSKPGIKFEFKLPQVIEKKTTGTGYKVSYLEDAYKGSTGKTMRGEVQFTDEDSPTNSTGFVFDIGTNGKVYTKVDPNTPIGEVIYDATSHTVTLYIVRNTDDYTGLDGKLIQWDGITEGMRIDTDLILDNEADIENKLDKTIGLKPLNKGYTYIQYTPKRKEDGLIFEIIPYKIDGEVKYTLQKTKLGQKPSTNGSITFDGEAGWDPVIGETIGTDRRNKPFELIAGLDIGADGKPTTYNQYYRIVAEYNSERYYSQVLEYNPDNYVVDPRVPDILNIGDIYVVPDEKSTEATPYPLAIGFTMRWGGSEEAYIKNQLTKGKVFFEVNLSKSNENVKDDPGALIKVFEVYQQGDDLKVRPYAGDAGIEDPATGDKLGDFDDAEDAFTMPKIELKTYGEHKQWQIINHPDLNTSALSDYPDLTNNVENKDKYDIPGVYYISIRSIFDPAAAGKFIVRSDYSKKAPITLNNVKEVISLPKTIRAEANQNKVNLIFDAVNLTDYWKYMIQPAKLFLNEDGKDSKDKLKRTYELYLYQDESITAEEIERLVDEGQGDRTLRDITTEQKDQFKLAQMTIEDRAVLRDKGILKIDYDSFENKESSKENLQIEGLEPNGVYYVYLRVKLKPYTNTGGILIPVDKSNHKKSIFSKIVSFTTDTKPLPPTPDEQLPPSPLNFKIMNPPGVSENSVTMQWEEPSLGVDENGRKEKVYYEILRTEEVHLKEELRKQIGKPIKEVVDEIGEVDTAVGFRIRPNYVKEYRGQSWIQTEQSVNLNEEILKFTDEKLKTNTIYYYYIRTVKDINSNEDEHLDKNKVTSQWIMIPVTTQNISKPKNLQVESKKVYEHNLKTETLVSFWAPLPTDAVVGTDYEFKFEIKSDKFDDFKPVSGSDAKYILEKDVNAKEIKNIEPPILEEADNGKVYQRYIYKITGLKPNTRYDIKVQIEDRTKEKENDQYPCSAFSNLLAIRTEYDEEEDEKENKYEEYLEKYDKEAEKLKRNPYWRVASGRNTAGYKYRESYMKTELTVSNEYVLVTEADIERLYYYMPANMLDIASRENTLLTAKVGDIEVSLRPYTLTNKNEYIKEALERIEDKKLKDYYIVFEVDLGSTRSRVDIVDPLTPEIKVDLRLAYLDQEDIFIEDAIMDRLTELIAEGREDMVDELERVILDKGDIDEDRLDSIIQKEITNIKEKHEKRVEDILDRQIDKTVSVDTIEKAMLIKATVDAFGITAYYKSGSWQPLYGFATGGGFAVEAAKLGVYIFAGKDGLATIFPDIPGAQDAIAKYQLAAIFPIDDATKMEWYATKEQVYKATARILGAQAYQDPVMYLQQRGIQGINRIGNNKAIRQDEAIYVMMQAYEKIYHKPINSIYISNKQSVQNIGSFQAAHRPYVYAAVELKVIIPTNNKVQTSSGVSCKQILGMLTKILPK